MKKILILLLFTGFVLNAQENKHEKIKALKTAYLTEKLELTSSEAEKFWPVYNLYDEKLHANRKECKKIFGKLNEETLDMTEGDANTLIEKYETQKTVELETRKQMLENLRDVISPNKIIKLLKAEEDFKKELLKRYKDGKG